MKKFFIVPMVSLMLVSTITVSAFAGTMQVNFNGVDRIFANASNVEGVTLVDAEELAKNLKVSYNFEAPTGIITLTDGQKKLVMKVNDKNATLNEKSRTLPVAPQKISENKVLVPLRFVSETFDNEVGYDNQTRTITVKNNLKYVNSLEKMNDVTKDTKVFTYDEALKKAISSSTSLKQTLISFDDIEANLADIQNAIDTTPNFAIDANGTTIHFGSSAVRQMYNSQQTILDTLALEDDSLEATKTGIELSLISALNTLETAKNNYVLAQDSLKYQEDNLKAVRLKNSLGIVSDDVVKQTEISVEKSRLTVDTLQQSINTAKENVNSIIGEPLTADTYVEYDTTIKNKDFDVEQLVMTARLDSMSVKQAENTQKQAQNNLKYLLDNDDYLAKKRNADSADLALSQAKKDVEKSVRSTYASYNQIIDNDKSLKVSLKDAINAYNSAVVSYNIGYITKLDLDGLALNIVNIESQIAQNELNYKTILFQLENPQLF